MSNARFIEIDSTYRDRTRFSNPSNFTVLISQSGTKNKAHALDPISTSAPKLSFSGSFDNSAIASTVTVGGILTTGIGLSNSPSKFVINSTTGTLRQIDGFYNGAIITITDGITTIFRRISDYSFIGDDGVQDIAIITVTDSIPDSYLVAGGVTGASIDNPTDTSTPLIDPVIFIGSGSRINNFYNTCLIYNETRDESTTIVSYDGLTRLATITPQTFTPTWLPEDAYSIRKELPFITGDILVAPTPTISTITISGGPSTNDTLIGDFIRIVGPLPGAPIDGPSPYNQIRRIVGYDAKLGEVRVYPSFDVVPVSGVNFYEILSFTRDNPVPFTYTGSLVSQQEMVCYEIELLNLILPNIDLKTGGRIAFYPYVYVELQNVSGASAGNKNVIYSNNPNATRMLFRAAIDDIPNPLLSPFIKIDGDGMIQTVKFKPTDNLKFGVYLPNGDPFTTILKDTESPLEPNPLIQISVVFSIKRL